VKAVIIHAAKDLRIEEREAEPLGPGQVEVGIEAGGICGSDLHYYNHGGFGTVRLREPMILGHEVAGTVRALGQGVSGLAVGDRVAVSPSRPCNACRYCLAGLQNQCLDMRFYGSAMPMPHIQGAFRQRLVAEAWQCHRIEDGISINEAAFAEPFAVTLHAVNRAGSLLGKRVLVTGGAGYIGAITAAALLDAARGRQCVLPACLPVARPRIGVAGYDEYVGVLDLHPHLPEVSDPWSSCSHHGLHSSP
jgi:L-idonate 5-dehydrogenase